MLAKEDKGYELYGLKAFVKLNVCSYKYFEVKISTAWNKITKSMNFFIIRLYNKQQSLESYIIIVCKISTRHEAKMVNAAQSKADYHISEYFILCIAQGNNSL